MVTIENCPLCGVKMEKGFLYCRSSYQWSIERKRFTNGMESIYRGPYLFGASSTEAYRCYKCKMVLFFYGEEKPKEEEK